MSPLAVPDRMRRDAATNGQTLPDLVNRSDAYTALTERLIHRCEPALYLYGPKGTGKTLLTQHVLRDHSTRTTVCSLSCIQHDTQYKALSALCAALTSDDITTGYHTAQLYTALTNALVDHDLVIVLDDIEFLLLNDGSDLLYTLSRLDQPQKPRLVLLSAAHPDLATELDERIYSSLQPATVSLEPYTAAETTQILEARVPDWLDQPVTDAALAQLAATTSNIRLVYHWLAVAGEITDGPITVDVIRLVRNDASQRYHTTLLAPFSKHHGLLWEAVERLTTEIEPVRSGAVYDRYREICTEFGTIPLSTRRISDFLKQLELLDLIRAEYHYGGHDGKTRHIWPQQPI